MKVSVEPRDRSMLIQAIRKMRESSPVYKTPSRGCGRRGELHCSHICDDLFIRLEKKARGRAADIDETTMLSFQEVGNALERIIAREMATLFDGWEKPAPFIYRQVRCSPDGYSPRAECVDEMKVLWRSIDKKDDPFVVVNSSGDIIEQSNKFRRYCWQVLFYGAGMDYAPRERIHALFINGNYRPPFPLPMTYRLRPSRDDLKRNEDYLLQHATDMGWL